MTAVVKFLNLLISMDIKLIFESYDYPYAIREGGGRLNVYVDRGRGKQNVYACLQGGREGSKFHDFLST